MDSKLGISLKEWYYLLLAKIVLTIIILILVISNWKQVNSPDIFLIVFFVFIYIGLDYALFWNRWKYLRQLNKSR